MQALTEWGKILSKIAYLPQILQLLIKCLPSLPQNLEILCGLDTWLYLRQPPSPQHHHHQSEFLMENFAEPLAVN